MHLYTKHATLINNCYPEKEGEKGPRSSELSYLMFYASSRPVKLTKVGLFLEKKAERDAVKGRKQNNQVSLEILKSLIEACHRDLNLFSKHVVKIIDMMVETKDIDIIDLACQFVIFTSYHDGSTLGVDTEFTRDYEDLLKKFAGFCSFDTSDDTLQLQMRYIGQRALQAAVTSTALQASNFKVQLDIILSPLIVTLANSKNPADALAQSEDVDIKQSAIGHETLNTHSVDILAAKTIAILFSKINGVAVKLSLNPLFSFMDTHQTWWPTTFAVPMMELALNSLQPQYRYLLVPEILLQLESIKSSSHDQPTMKKHASLVSILDTILDANIPLVGISVLEVLNSLFIHLVQSVQDFKVFLREKPSASEYMLVYAIQHGLAHSIGGLATQTYYLNQLNDITGYLIAKLKVGNTATSLDGLAMKDYRSVVLECLDLVMTASSVQEKVKEDTESHHESMSAYSSSITLDVWTPALGLLTEKELQTRVEFGALLAHYLQTTGEPVIEPYPKHTLNQHGDVMLVNSLHQSILDWVQLENLGVRDMVVIRDILSALIRRFGADETIKAVPLIFKLQELVEQGVIQNTGRQKAVAALVIEWLAMVGEFYHIDSLIEYADQLKQERMDSNQYSTVFSDSESHTSFEEDTTGVSLFVDRKTVVNMLSNDGPLRDEEDTEGIELETKLMEAWGAAIQENHDRTFRIRTSRNLSDLKAKLATPWTNLELSRDEQGKKQTIRVENLKDALLGQNNDSLAKKSFESTQDMTLLLQSLSLGTHVH
ncbi:plasma membrane localization protein, partial [Rhizopus stolonifer]